MRGKAELKKKIAAKIEENEEKTNSKFIENFFLYLFYEVYVIY